jgi:hypothetical protein
VNFRIIYLCLFFVLYSGESYSQKKKGAWYVSISPTIGNSINTYTNDPGSAYKDSLKKLDRWRTSIGASLLYSVETGNNNQLMTGLQFLNFGFTRKREDFRFLDTLHPDIGFMSDKSKTGGNSIEFNNRYQYLAIPFLFSTKISGRGMKTTSIHWTAGGSVAMLLNHDIRAVLNGFTKNGKDVFILDDQKDNPSRININLQTGFRLENQLYGKNTLVFIQPTFYFPLFSANYGIERHHLYSITCEVGIVIKPKTETK